MSTATTAPAVSAADVRRWAASPLDFFADTIIPVAGADVRLGDCWAGFQVEAFKVLAGCISAVAVGSKPPYRGLWIERTKGASKDSDIGLALCWLLMFARRPQSIELAADDFDQIGETRKAMVAIIRCNPWMNDRLTIQTTKVVCEATASEALFLTRDSSGSHGSRPTVTIANELSHCTSEEFLSTVMDNSDKIPNNLCIIATNAGTLGSWQYRWRTNYSTDPSWFFQKVECVAPWIDAVKVADAERRNAPGRFRRLWKGEWIAAGGDLLSPAQIERAVKYDEPLYGDDGWANLGAIGVDLGVASHHSAIVVLQGNQREMKLRVAKVVDFRPPVMLQFVRDTILRMVRQYRITSVYLDAWQGLRIAEELKALGLAVYAEHQNGAILTKQSGALLQVFQDDLLQLYRGDEGGDLLLKDLNGARIQEMSYGHRIVSDEGPDGHGDRLSALLQCLPGMLESLGGPAAVEYEMPRAPSRPYVEPYWEPLSY